MGKSNAVTPNALSVTLSKRFGRTITPKAVRTVARSILAQYDKVKHPAYQSHTYDAAMQSRIAAAFAARSSRTASASTAKVAARKPRKAAPVAVTVEA